MEEMTMLIFYSLKLFPWQVPFLSILQPPLSGFSSFFCVASRDLFLASALQGLEGPSSSGFGLENGIGGFVTPTRTIV